MESVTGVLLFSNWECLTISNISWKYYFFRVSLFFPGKGEEILLIPLYHFHPLHKHLDIRRAINAESSPLRLTAGLEPGTFGFRAQIAKR